MGGSHPPGYHARRRRIERWVLKNYKATRPDDYQQAWADGEARENQKEAE